jgi:glutathione-regulated potassium-efflux system protein KefB
MFFLGVGMSIDLAVIVRHWPLILVGVPVYMLVKAAGVYLVARIFRANHREGVYRAALLAQGGEFAFVLYSAAAATGLFDGRTNAILTATVIVSMALTPLFVAALRFLAPERPAMAGVEVARDLHGSVLIIGFGRFGQVVSQSMLARGIDVSIIDIDTEMIRSAGDFGFKVYYGDGTRLDLLRAAGAGGAKAILVCVDDWRTADRIVEIARIEFPLAQLMVRAYDREHALKLVELGIDRYVRETFESAMKFSEMALGVMGVPDDEAAEIAADIRRRDADRFALEITGGIYAGADLLHSNVPKPVPFTTPRRAAPKPDDADKPAAPGTNG